MKFAFTADSHLGQIQYGIFARVKDYELAFNSVAYEAARRGCDAILLGGDVFHTMRPPITAVETLRMFCQYFTHQGGKVLSIDGNHDNTSGGWPSICGAYPIGNTGYPYILKGRDLQECRIYGIDGGSTPEILSQLDRFAASGVKSDVLAMHLPLTEMAGFPTPICAKDIAAKIKNTGVKLVLLGDIHDGQEAVVDGIRFIYSGSPEVTAADERPEKSFLVVTYDMGRLDVERVPIKIREQKFVKIESEKDIEDFSGTVTQGPLYHIACDCAVQNVKERVSEIAGRAGALFRIIPIPREKTVQTTGYDRSGYRASLSEIVEADFADNPDAKNIILESLGLPPETATEPAKKYLHRMGVRV